MHPPNQDSLRLDLTVNYAQLDLPPVLPYCILNGARLPFRPSFRPTSAKITTSEKAAEVADAVKAVKVAWHT